MVKSVVARKATEVARKRELLNFEATNVVLDEGLRSLRKVSKLTTVAEFAVTHQYKFQEQPRKIIKKKPVKKSLKTVLSGIKKENSRSTFIDKSKQLTKFVLKKHIEEYIFDSEVIKTFTEGDYLAKFWSPIIEKLFRNSGIIPHWYADT
ncbi:uncharacterized protein EV154DRAFT_548550 [Mucor mucedo]|uniref:uncharacterized protein n=1 Tax=Mucor mucedo TaxID=29922 RepID=UPI002220D374|nr:uncharacterized protein EV154DRAFT_548550 [Mucor mucedo]KAI7894959.1 hypothetical protein EV154DRAFT_548550 [Mucor mucedo]